MILWEELLISVLSWGLACVITLRVSWAMSNAIGKVGLLKPLDFAVSWQAVGAWLGLVSLFSLLVGLVPSFQAKRMAVREVLGYE